MSWFLMISISSLTSVIYRVIAGDRIETLVTIIMWISFTAGYLARALDDADKKKG